MKLSALPWLEAAWFVSTNKQLPRLSKSVHGSTAIIPMAVAEDVAMKTTPLKAVAVTVSNNLLVVSRLYLPPAVIYPHAILSNHPCFQPYRPISLPYLLQTGMLHLLLILRSIMTRWRPPNQTMMLRLSTTLSPTQKITTLTMPLPLTYRLMRIPTYLLVKISFLLVAHHSTGLLPNGSARLTTDAPPLMQVGLSPSFSPPN